MEDLRSERVVLRLTTTHDVDALRTIRDTPTVCRWWGHASDQPGWPLDEPDTTSCTVWHGGEIIGFVQWYQNENPKYRHAGIDLFLVDAATGQGLGREVVTRVRQHLVDDLGHHRIVIDPAAHNMRAIACYTACGFRTVGTMHRYEQDDVGDGWHDGLLMEYVTPP